MVNSGLANLLLHLVKFWRACAVNEGNQDLPMALHCSHMMYPYYSCVIFPSQTQLGRKSLQQNIQQYTIFDQKPSSC